MRSKLVVGVIILGLLKFQPVAEGSGAQGSVAAVHEGSVLVNTGDLQPNLDMSQLAQLDIDPVLLQFIGSVVKNIQGLENELHAVRNENAVLQNRTQVVEAESAAVRVELKQVKKDKETLENKTQLWKRRISHLRDESLFLRIYRARSWQMSRTPPCGLISARTPPTVGG